MQPKAQTAQQSSSGWEPKWRHFHPLERVWVQNPFDHDVVFQVADEFNRPFKYKLPAKKVSELPGGAIATLGVKAIVDELIQNDDKDNMRMWDKNVRGKHENNIIMRLKETSPIATNSATPGEIDLSVKSSDAPAVESTTETVPETAFPGLNEPQLAELPPAAAAGLDDVVNASLPATDSVVEG